MTNATKTTKSPLRAVSRSPLVPHVAFWGLSLVVKLVFPSLLKWVAYDSITTLLVSVWYPLCATIALIHRDKGQQQLGNDKDSLRFERQFWIEYWSIGFATVQFLHRFVSAVPSLRQVGRYEYPQLPVILAEVKLLIFVWVFVMETLLARYQRYLGIDEQKEHWREFVPLTFLTKTIGPKLLRLQQAISEPISKDTWQRFIKRSRAQRVLEVMVMLQFIESESMEYLMQLLEEGRSFMLLSVFMVLPSSICQVGVLYAQFIFPSARSLQARGDALEILSLKYWVLNNVFSLFLSVTWWVWWCVPFSDQLLLGTRCFATFPSTITHHYSTLEMELITFGILSGKPKLTVKKTKTVQALRALVKRLPRDKHAQVFEFEIDEPDRKSKHADDDSSIGSVDTTESEEERRRKRRREKRANRKLLKQKKSSGSNNSTGPPSLVTERFDARGTRGDKKNHNANETDDSSDEDKVQYSSFINANENHDRKFNNDHSDPTGTKTNQYSRCSTEKEQRDARDADSEDSTSEDEIRHSISFSKANDDCSEHNENNAAKSQSLSVDTDSLIPVTLSPAVSANEYKDMSSKKLADSKENDEDNDRALLPSMTIGSNYSTSQLQADAKLANLSIASPTENIVDEVEIQVKGTPNRSKSTTERKMTVPSMFPVTYPYSSGRNFLMPLASNEDERSLKSSVTLSKSFSSKPQAQSPKINHFKDTDAGSYLSEIDTTASSTIGESFDEFSPLHETSLKAQEQHDGESTTASTVTATTISTDEMSTTKAAIFETKVDTDFQDIIRAPRQSSRLAQLREWQERKNQEEESKRTSGSIATRAKSSTSDKVAKRSNTSKAKASTEIEKTKKSGSEEISKVVKKKTSKSGLSSPKRTSKKSNAVNESIASKPTTASIGKRAKKKSSAASPSKTTKSSKKKGEAPLQDNSEVEADRTSSSSPRKRRVPNSKRKKSSMFGGVLGRK